MLSETLLIQFTRNLAGKDVDALIRAAKTESETRMIGQGLAHMALFISEMMLTTSGLDLLRLSPIPASSSPKPAP